MLVTIPWMPLHAKRDGCLPINGFHIFTEHLDRYYQDHPLNTGQQKEITSSMKMNGGGFDIKKTDPQRSVYLFFKQLCTPLRSE